VSTASSSWQIATRSRGFPLAELSLGFQDHARETLSLSSRGEQIFPKEPLQNVRSGWRLAARTKNGVRRELQCWRVDNEILVYKLLVQWPVRHREGQA
jgi:hypothetical protein